MNLYDTVTYMSQIASLSLPGSLFSARRQEARKLHRLALRAKVRLFRPEKSALKFYISILRNGLVGRRVDTTIVSYAKSGRTWLEQLLIQTIRAEKRLSEDRSKTIAELCRNNVCLPQIALSHAGSSWEGIIRDEDTISKVAAERYATDKVVFLYRDPRDVLVSAFHHIKSRTGMVDLTPERLIRSPVVGLRKVIRFMNLWDDFAEAHSDRCIRLSYENLKEDTVSQLTRIFEFIRTDVSDASLVAAVDACEFNTMKRKERKGAFNNPRLGPVDVSNPNSFKVRSGKTGEYLEFFSRDQIDFINEMIEKELNQSFGYTRMILKTGTST